MKAWKEEGTAMDTSDQPATLPESLTPVAKLLHPPKVPRSEAKTWLELVMNACTYAPEERWAAPTTWPELLMSVAMSSFDFKLPISSALTPLGPVTNAAVPKWEPLG